MILDSYVSRRSKIKELVEETTQKNICNFDLDTNPNSYIYKIKRFLTNTALGMKAGKVWNGTFNADGGYIVVKKDGELVCYHIYNWNDFQNYLFEKNKIDHPDSKLTRCDYGRIIDAEEAGMTEGSYVKLNFQIRFI